MDLYKVTLAATLVATMSLHAEAQVSGCYDASFGPWSPIDSTHLTDLPRPAPPDESADSVYYSIPPRIRFDSAPAPFPREGYNVLSRARGRSAGAASECVLARVVGQLAVCRLDWIRRHHNASRPGWAQVARSGAYGSDVAGILRYERPVLLVPVDCSSPPPVPADADMRLLRSVPFGESVRLTLGEPIRALCHLSHAAAAR